MRQDSRRPTEAVRWEVGFCVRGMAVRWTFLGTQEGEIRGISPTGKKVLMTGMHMYHFGCGQAENLWANWDTLGYLQQLGVIQSLG